MANDMIRLKAEANKLGVTNYRTMNKDDLLKAIKTAKGKGSTPAKGKTNAGSANGRSTAKGKGTSAAKGKTTAAASPAKGKGKSVPAKSKTQKTSPAKGKAAQGTAKRQTSGTAKSRGKKNLPARNNIDRKSINWSADSNIGKNGKRKDVMLALKKRKGNYDKVFEDLKANAKRYYPSKTKQEAEGMLRWLINRVAFDFVVATGQHTSGERAAYGTSDKPNDVRRRELREQARKAAAKAERAAKRGGTARKPAGGRQTGSKGKTQARSRTSASGAKKGSGAKGKGKTRR